MIVSCLAHSVESDLAKGVMPRLLIKCGKILKINSHKRMPLQYIKFTLTSLLKGNINALSYFTRIKDLWDELVAFQVLPTSNQIKAHNDQTEEDYLIQFLMGLNNVYNIV